MEKGAFGSPSTKGTQPYLLTSDFIETFIQFINLKPLKRKTVKFYNVKKCFSNFKVMSTTIICLWIASTLNCCIAAYIYIYKYKCMPNIIKHNDDFNERTNTFLYKNISLTLYSRKGWCWLCVRGELKTETDCYILNQVLMTIAALLSNLGWDCSTVGHREPKALCLPLALTSVSCPQQTPTGSNRLGHLFI